MQISPKEYRLLKEIVQILNDAYPTKDIKISAERWSEYKVEKFTSTPDPYFGAYKSNPKLWYLYSTDLYVYREAYDDMCRFVKLVKQELNIKVIPCQIHVTYTAQLMREHKEKKVFFIGECTWAEPKY